MTTMSNELTLRTLLENPTLTDLVKAFYVAVDLGGGRLQVNGLGYLHVAGDPDEDFTEALELFNGWVDEGLIEFEIDENGDAQVLERI